MMTRLKWYLDPLSNNQLKNKVKKILDLSMILQMGFPFLIILVRPFQNLGEPGIFFHFELHFP